MFLFGKHLVWDEMFLSAGQGLSQVCLPTGSGGYVLRESEGEAAL